MKKIMIATGGTGGHIYPALALADKIKERYPECEIIFYGSSNRMEAEMIPSRGYRFIGMEMTGMNGGISDKVRSAVSLLKADRKCRTVLKKENPEICIGFGNYISVPLIMAAHRLHIPTMISEQNSFAGKANAMLARYADAVEGVYQSCLDQFPAGKTRLYGNPQASVASQRMIDPAACEAYGIRKGTPFAVFMMGSLGSATVSKVIDEACGLFDQDFEVLIAAGKANDYRFTTDNPHVHITEYVDGMAMLKCADLSVCRAGATTLCEIAATGAASILIPSPFVPNNHQVYNAMELVRNDAAVMIEEKDLTAELLAEQVNSLMKNKERRSLLSDNALKMSTPDAADRMIDWIEELISK